MVPDKAHGLQLDRLFMPNTADRKDASKHAIKHDLMRNPCSERGSANGDLQSCLALEKSQVPDTTKTQKEQVPARSECEVSYRVILIGPAFLRIQLLRYLQ